MFRDDPLLWRLTLALSVVSLIPMLMTPFLPLVDLGSHIGAAGLLDDLLAGAPVVKERYAFNATLLPYWTGYFLMGALDLIGGPFFAAKATVAVVVLLLPLSHMRLLVALGWVAAGFLFDLGVTLEWGEVRLLRRLGGGEDRPTRPPGKIVLTRGLRRLLDHLATEAILADEERRHGALPPRIAAMLGRPASSG